MAYSVKSRGKIVRRLALNVFGNPKYDKLLQRKPHGPGVERGSRQRRNKVSDYGRQLLEKQKLRFAYGLREKQFYGYYLRAKKMKKGLTGDNFLILLERRLDNIVYRAGWARSRVHARQLVSHGHLLLNGRKVDIPSISAAVNDVISLKDKEGSRKMIRDAMVAHQHVSVPNWLLTKEDELEIHLARLPERADIPSIANEQLVVEFYSR